MDNQIFKDLENKILVLDGATGTAIQNYNLQENDFRGEKFKSHSINLKGCNEILNITKPEVIKEIHRRYIESGADIIETNSFNCNRLSLEDYGIPELSYTLSKEAALIAVKCSKDFKNKTGKTIYVAGSIGPTSKSCCIPSGEIAYERNIDFDTLKTVYREQIQGVIDGGVDILLIETIFDGLNAKAALLAAEEIMEKQGIIIPIMISLTVDKKGNLISGQNIESLITAIDRDSIISYGLNCSFGAKDLIPIIKKLENFTRKKISLYPNAGLPNENGEYEESAEEMLEHLKELIDTNKINILGGCCGTTYQHIKVISDYVKNKNPRILLPNSFKNEDNVFLSGNEVLYSTKVLEKPLTIIGERNNMSGSKIFKRLIEERNYIKAMEIARKQISAGAKIIDINLDDSFLDSKEEMINFLRVLQNDPLASKIPIMIDSSDFTVIEAALKNISGKPIVNSLSLKEGVENFKLKANIIKKYGASLVVMAFDEKGQGVTFERKKEICVRAKHILNEIGYKDKDIIFDPNILTIGTGTVDDKYNGLAFLETVKYLRKAFPQCGITGGLSNVSFAFRGNIPLRAAIHKIFLELANEAGMDMVILNPEEESPSLSNNERLLIENLIFGKEDSTSEILNISFIKKDKKEVSVNTTPIERIEEALINGGSTTFENDLEEVLKIYSPLDTIQKVLMEGMNKVGNLFEKGELYLPQIIRSASVMEKAVSIIMPLLEKNQVTTSRGKIIMATVEGDVHDIGKNIVGTVLKCNGFEIIDLGVMASCEKILKKALELKPDIVTLSGLITPSLKEMEKILIAFRENNLNIPVLIAGAAASKLHTAVKLEPHYPGNTFYVTDASGTIPVVSAICSNEKDKFLLEKTNELDNLRKLYNDNQNKKENEKIIKNNNAENKSDSSLLFLKDNILKPKELGKHYLEIPIFDLRKYINWDILLHILKVKNTSLESKTLEDAKEFYKKMEKENYFVKCCFGFFNCKKILDKVEIHGDEIHSIHMPRGSYKELSLSLSDFIQSEDYIGAFAASVSNEKIDEIENEYFKILRQIIETRVVEAASEYLQEYINLNYWKVDLRPAIGYSTLPDHSIKKNIFQLIDGHKTGIKLTSTYAMSPLASVCGIYISNEKGFYFDLKDI